MSEYDVHVRRQLAAERAERLARDYGPVQSAGESRALAGRARRGFAVGSLVARLRRGSVDHAPALRS